MPLAFSASITFEQMYSGVEGDSASVSELFALLSSLSEIPVKQGIAVTGSVNHLGEIQPVVGCNEKIEGMYKVCKLKGLTDEQGVIIPRRNMGNLMLEREVIVAIRDRKFHLWAVDSVDEGIEILTGVAAGTRGVDGEFPAGSINHRVEKRLRELATKIQGHTSP